MRTAIVLALLAAAAVAQENPFAEALREGQTRFDAGQFEEAAESFARARQLAPTAWQGHAFQAMAHLEQARREPNPVRRAALLRQAESVASDLVHKAGVRLSDPFYRFLRGMVALIGGNVTEAWDLLIKAANGRQNQYAAYGGFPLQHNAERGAVQAALHLATQMIVNGKFETADKIVARTAPHLHEDDPNRPAFERIVGVVSEQLGRYDKAVKHLRLCMELSNDPVVTEELLSAIAMMYLQNERFDEGKEVLAEIPAESTHPQVIAARCMAIYKKAMLEPDGPPMDEALRYYRDVMKTYPDEDVYYLAEQWGDMVLERVGPARAAAERELLLETVALLEREVKRRPECPSLYFKLHRLHKLLGNEEEATRYAELHTVKKKDWTNKIKFNAQGKPRCR